MITYTDLVAGAAILAIALASGASVLAFQARHYAARALTGAHTHPRNPPVPAHLAHERRQADTGPPPGTHERRAAHRAPDNIGRYSQLRAAADQRIAHEDRDDPQPDTGELTPPTRDMHAIHPDQPPR